MTAPHTAGMAESPRGRAEKADRAEEMLAAFNAGLTPQEIAEDFGVTSRCVYIRLNDLGIEFDSTKRRDAALWSLPDDERRVIFAQRAAKAAREQLKQIRSHSPLSTVFTGAGEIPLTQAALGQDASS